MGDDGLFAQFVALQLGRDPALAHDEHAVGEPHDLRQFRGDHDDRSGPRRRVLRSDVDFGFRSDVDAAGRLVEQKDLATRRDPASDDRLLLVAAAEEPDRPIDLKGRRLTRFRISVASLRSTRDGRSRLEKSPIDGSAILLTTERCGNYAFALALLGRKPIPAAMAARGRVR